MQIGIIGAGSLGRALGQRLAARGHEIMFGGGEAATVGGAKAGANADAVAFGDVVVLAVPFGAVGCALADAGPLRDRVLWTVSTRSGPTTPGWRSASRRPPPRPLRRAPREPA
jgi:8-hydroxy-5-deazaflavin:NADPH oxidoreductase